MPCAPVPTIVPPPAAGRVNLDWPVEANLHVLAQALDRDVEDLISSHPAVEYVAVVGMPDPELGEKICAYLTPASGRSVSHQELIDHLLRLGCRKALLPAHIELVEQIPLTAAGKADKKALRADIEAKLQRVAAC